MNSCAQKWIKLFFGMFQYSNALDLQRRFLKYIKNYNVFTMSEMQFIILNVPKLKLLYAVMEN